MAWHWTGDKSLPKSGPNSYVVYLMSYWSNILLSLDFPEILSTYQINIIYAAALIPCVTDYQQIWYNDNILKINMSCCYWLNLFINLGTFHENNAKYCDINLSVYFKLLLEVWIHQWSPWALAWTMAWHWTGDKSLPKSGPNSYVVYLMSYWSNILLSLDFPEILSTYQINIIYAAVLILCVTDYQQIWYNDNILEMNMS